MQENIGTGASGGKLVFHLFGALAEFERKRIRERSQAGPLAARARARMGGWRKALDPGRLALGRSRPGWSCSAAAPQAGY
nr:recombinase family protein [Duganella vulcania]